MVQDGHVILLSRYFNKNTQIVAGMCPRCFEECDEVRIIAVNIKFLTKMLNIPCDKNNIGSSEHVEGPTLVEDDKTNEMNENWHFKGFSNSDMKYADMHVKKLTKVFELVNIDGKNAPNISKYFYGFSKNEINVSHTHNKKVSTACESISFKIYKETNIKSNRYNKLKKSTKPKASLDGTYKGKHDIELNFESRSKYFWSNNNISKLKFTIRRDNIKKELPEVKISETDLKVEHYKLESIKQNNLDTFKDEPPTDYFENEYFKILQNNPVAKMEEEDKKYPIWIPPKSPHNLIEESLYHDPWALLIATIFLNRTKCMIARPYVFWFLKENPDPLCVLEKYPQDLEKYFVNLGLQKTRAAQIWRMSNDYVYKKWNNVKELYGIGLYGETAFRMFCLGDFSVKPKDRFLRIYKAWYENIGSKKENECDVFK